ncbi:MAG: alanine/glycine:cation symporter family protein [Flavobacteriaceae bacterium]|jgi:AGCS family alanine or glycine:cation symporter|nr:alanine/glycine:cation symporter family protein [Flavobacteriaceae bacterium]
MKKLSLLYLLLLPTFVFGQEKDLDQKIDGFIQPIVDVLGSFIFFKPLEKIGFGMPLVVLWLMIGAVFFTFYMKVLSIEKLKHAYRLIRGDYDKLDGEGEVSHFQALSTALSGTVGLGNIAGVAVAISIGGAGATFWMIVAGFLGMSSKFVECTLGVKYRRVNNLGEVSGGPMYYLSDGLKKKGFARLGKFLAILFAILCVGGSLGGGNMFQANQSFAQFVSVFPFFEGKGFYYGIVVSVLVAVVIIGGIRKIANVTDKLVPLMVVIYVSVSLLIIFMNFSYIDDAFKQIFAGAFTSGGVTGGVFGALIVGFQRAAFSNEAGVGSAAIAHSAVKTEEPVSEGIVALLGPFIDTVLICTMTALVLVFTGYATDTGGMTGAALTSAAFSSVLPWFKYILLLSVFLFAFSTMIAWSYYGMKAWGFLFGNNKRAENLYKFVFLVFIILGSSASLNAVIDFSDMMLLGMGFPNVLGLFFFSGEIKRDVADYFKRLKSGEIKRYN